MIVRTQFTDVYLTTMLPLLDEVIWGKFRQYPLQWPRVFRRMKSTRSAEQTTQLTGLGLFTQVNEGGTVIYDQPAQGFDKTYTHLDYALGFKVSHQLVRDDKIGQVKRLGTELGRSARETQEIDHASVFNNGFTAGAFAGPDGKALFASDHPLVKAGGTQSNILAVAADLDVDGVRLMLTLARQTKDSSGKRVRIPPRKLVCHSDNEFVAAEILKSIDRSDTANRATNALRHRDGYPAFDDYMVWDYLTDADAWFICGDVEDSELRHYDRESETVVHDVDFDSRATKTAMWYAQSFGFSDFYGVWGTPGA